MKPRIHRTHFILAGVALALGIAARLHGLALESATGDEVFTVSLLNAPSYPAFAKQSAIFDPTARLAPVYGIVAYAWAQVFGSGLLAGRALSVLLSVACIPLVYALGLRLAGGAIAAFLGSLLAAVSLPCVFYGQDIRFYALLQLLALVSMLAFAYAIESDCKWAWLIHFAANTALLWTHSFAPLLWLAQGAYLLCFHRRPCARWVGWTLAHMALLCLFAVWLMRLGYSPASEAAPYQDRLAGWRECGAAWLMFAGGRFSEENPAPYLPGGLSMDPLLGLALAAASLRLTWQAANRRHQAPEAFRGTVLIGLWLIVPLAALYVFSLEWRMVFYPRYAIYCAFPASLLLAAGATRGLRPATQAVLATLLVAASCYQVFALPKPFRADYQAAARDIHRDPDAAVHALKPFNARAAAYALGVGDYRTIENWGLPELCSETEAQAIEGRTVWVLFHRWDRTADFETAMQRAGLNAEKHRYAGMPPLIGYRVRRAEQH